MAANNDKILITKDQVIETIQDNINDEIEGGITGSSLQDVLLDMVKYSEDAIDLNIVNGEGDNSIKMITYGSDEENNTFSKNTSALGIGNSVGLKGWYFTHVIDNEDTLDIYLSKTQPKSIITKATPDEEDINSGYSVGDRLSIITTNNNIYKSLQIKDVDKNKITVYKNSGEDSTDSYDVIGDSTYSYDFIEDSTYSYDFIEDSTYSYDFIEDSTDSYNFGDKAENSWDFTVFSENNFNGDTLPIDIGVCSVAIGMNNTASGINNITLGYGNKTLGIFSQAIGYNTETTNVAECAIGKYNESKDGMIFSVGIGNGVNNRKNAIEVINNTTTISNLESPNAIIDTLSITNEMTLSNLTVTGDTELNKNLTVNGETTLKDKLTVNGDTELNKNLTVNGETTLNKNLTVTEETILKDALNVEGDAKLSKNLTVNGETILNKLTASEIFIENNDNSSLLDTIIIQPGDGEKSGVQITGDNTAEGNYSLALGSHTQTNNENEVALGRYNNSIKEYIDEDTKKNIDKFKSTLFSIGIGNTNGDDVDRKNTLEVKQNGNIYIKFQQLTGKEDIGAKDILGNDIEGKYGLLKGVNNINYYYDESRKDEDKRKLPVYDIPLHILFNWLIARIDNNNSGNNNSGNNNSEKIINVTYSDLVNLKGSYVPGQQYRIIDYVTTTSQENTQSAGHQFDLIVTADDKSTLNENARAIQHEENESIQYSEYSEDYKSIQYLEDSEDYKSIQYSDYSDYSDYSEDSEESIDTYFYGQDLSAWEIKYCIDNDTDRFAWADSTNGKGVIYYMKDEHGNECPYDFKNIMFIRYQLEAPSTSGYTEQWVEQLAINIVDQFTYNQLSYIWGGLDKSIRYWDLKQECYSINNGTTKAFYTFSNIIDDTVSDKSITSYCYNNVIKEYIKPQKLYLNNNVFFNRSNTSICRHNYFGNDCYNNSFGNSCTSNSFEYVCYENSFGNNCYSNSFGNYCYKNSFGDSGNSNSFGNSCARNSFGYSGADNSFGNGCYNNSFGFYCLSNSFGNSCSRNSFGESCDYNSFGNYCQYNSFGNECDYNSFGNNCQYNSFGEYCFYNSFGNYCYNNSFGNNCYNNSFGNDCNWNSFRRSASASVYDNSTLKSYCYYNHFDDGCSYNVLWNEDTTGSNNKLQNINVKRGVSGTYSVYNYISIPKINAGYEITVAKNTSGNIKIYCEADMVE